MPLLRHVRCSESQLEQLCQQLYTDALAVTKQAALYVLAEEEEERDEPPGGCCLGLHPVMQASKAVWDAMTGA